MVSIDLTKNSISFLRLNKVVFSTSSNELIAVYFTTRPVLWLICHIELCLCSGVFSHSLEVVSFELSFFTIANQYLPAAVKFASL